MSDRTNTSRLLAVSGSLREMLGGVGNLKRLLASRTVAPKSISTILPDIAASCGPLAAELANVTSDATARESEALTELSHYLASQVNDLETALGVAAKKRTMNASGRLNLERSVVSISRNLAGGLPLLELLRDARPTPAPLDVVELLSFSRQGDQPRTPQTRAVTAHLNSPNRPILLHAAPRAAISLIGLAAALVNRAAETPQVLVSLTHCGAENRLSVASSADDGQEFQILLPPLTPATEPGVVAAAKQLKLQAHSSPSRLEFIWYSEPQTDTQPEPPR